MALVSTTVGRGALLDEAELILRRCGQVWLCGMAGVGKSRMAAELLRLRGGIWVSARDLVDGEALVAAIRDAARFPGHDATPGSLGAWLRGTPLLVIDNVDAVYEAAARWVADLSAFVPVVATTQRAVGTDSALVVRPLEPSDAVALFVSALPARVASPVDPARDAPRLQAITAALGGLPLALGLAASRLAVMTLEELVEELDLELLREPGSRTVGVERTLEAAVAQLDPAHAEALLALAAFSDHFGRESVAGVLGTSPTGALDILQGLASRHLVDVAAEGGKARFKLHPLVRTWARTRWTPTSGRAARAAHGAWFAQQGEAWRAKAWGPEFEAAQAWIRRESAELAEVVAHAEAGALPVEDAAKAVSALSIRWESPFEFALFDRAIALARAVGSRRTVGQLLARRADAGSRVSARSATWLADAAEAAALLDAEGAPDEAQFARGLSAGYRLSQRFDPADLATLGDAIERTTDLYPRGRLRQLRAMWARRHIGDDQAIADKQAFVDWAESTGNGILIAGALHSLWATTYAANRHAEADTHLDRALALVGDEPPPFMAHLLGADGVRKQIAGDLTGARARFEGAVERLERIGAIAGLEHERLRLMLVRLELGEEVDASALAPENLLSGWTTSKGLLGVVRAAAALRARRPLPPRPPSVTPEVDALLAAWWDLAEAVARAREAAALGDAPATAEAAEAAEAALERLPPGPGSMVPYQRLGATLVAEARSLVGAWRLGEHGAGFAAPAGEWVDLRSRAPLARLVDRLGGGGVHDLADLGAHGWPGDRSSPDSIRNRVHVALSTLRKLGFTLIRTTEGGWRLDPDVVVVRVSEAG